MFDMKNLTKLKKLEEHAPRQPKHSGPSIRPRFSLAQSTLYTNS